MKDIEREVLTKVQVLHDLIEDHPYMSGLMTKEFHGYLDFVIMNAHHLDNFNIKEWRSQPNEDDIEKWL
jgi:hypothetical protein